MSRKSAYTILLLATMAVGFLIWNSSRPKNVDAQKIFTAAQTYTRSLSTSGLIIPPTVSLQELIKQGLLHPSDVSGFAGAEVTISLLVDGTNPRAVLMRAKFSDGQEILTLADGSVQSSP